ncbi:BlaI/MecI/CopY family transcriptional regulator [Nocardioides limicola]|uniref:BlaI/MecI/CopY family transcriptional regulator n=1 Tax=Nocardioides limicola TaxID=2803368 RepID=UPI0027DE0BF5|nr:BlaI/MecI/CopY family transcriptional regulator [Nocardioides sp. DJM-14]
MNNAELPSSSRNLGRATLGELERGVLEVLWALPDHRSVTVRDVHASLAESRSIAYTTVMTVMERLARKGLVDQTKDGRAYTYRPRASRGELTAELMHAALDEVGSADRSGALVAFVAEASADEVEALRAALSRLEQ